MSSLAADTALFHSQLEALKAIPVVFPDTYQAPPQSLPSRIAVFHVSGNTIPDLGYAAVSCGLPLVDF